jgi:UbiD family decarboxylase
MPLARHGYKVLLLNHVIFPSAYIATRMVWPPGGAEHHYVGNVLAREPLLLRFVRLVSQKVTALHIPTYGNGFLAFVQIEKSNLGEPKNVALAAMTAHLNIKKVIVVDLRAYRTS